MGLLLASELVVCGRSVMAAVVVEVVPAAGFKLEVDVEDGFVEFNGFEDQELQVSQPSADRVDSRQQDHRLPVQRPA